MENYFWKYRFSTRVSSKGKRSLHQTYLYKSVSFSFSNCFHVSSRILGILNKRRFFLLRMILSARFLRYSSCLTRQLIIFFGFSGAISFNTHKNCISFNCFFNFCYMFSVQYYPLNVILFSDKLSLVVKYYVNRNQDRLLNELFYFFFLLLPIVRWKAIDMFVSRTRTSLPWFRSLVLKRDTKQIV